MPLSQSPPTKEVLAEQAKALDVEGRSTMTKDELAAATAASGSILSGALGRLTEIWATVGHNTVNDQPVKNPTDEELEQIIDLLGTAAKYAKTMRKQD